MANQELRNIALVGHGGTGKTSLFERILVLGEVVHQFKPVPNGRSVSDSTDEEIAHKMSIHAALGHVQWQGCKINVIDTPGAGDFVGEVISSLRAVECAIVVVGADVGVQVETIKVWRRLAQLGVPRMVFVNGCDKEHADFHHTLADLRERLQGTFVPVSLPIGSGADCTGVYDLLSEKGLDAEGKSYPPQEELRGAIDQQHTELVEGAAEGNDALMEKYLEQEQLNPDEIASGLRLAIGEASVVPVLAGSALIGLGVRTLLNVVSQLGPAPDGEGAPDAPVAAFVFKTAVDQYSGRLSYVKVVSGTLTSDSDLINSRDGHKERIGRLHSVQGHKIDDVERLQVGDLGVLLKLSDTATGETLCTPDESVKLAALVEPQPVHSLAIAATFKKDEDKLGEFLARGTIEDPTFTVRFDPETKETVISGMGELHLNIMLERLREHHKIELETKVPRVAYRETITRAAAAEHLHKKQTGGHGQYARVSLEIAPLPRGEQFKFVSAVFGGAISKSYVAGVEKGVLEAMEVGVLAGYPVVDFAAKVLDGKEHAVDSSELAFKLAAREATKAAIEKAGPVLLEPVMDVMVHVDDAYLGDVLSDLSARRGRVLGQEPLGGGIEAIHALVPHAELLRYSIDLRSITSGTATFEMQFSGYAAIGGRIAEDVINRSREAVIA